MLVVNEDVSSMPRSSRESFDVSDEETAEKASDQKVGSDEMRDIKRTAFQKPSLSLTLVTEDEDGNVSLRTQEFEDDKHVTLIMDNEEAARSGEGEEMEDESNVREDLGEALRDMRVMSSLMKSRKSSSSRSAGMRRWKGTIIPPSSDSEDEDFISKMSLMLLKSDETPVLTVPVAVDDGCLTDTENIDD